MLRVPKWGGGGVTMLSGMVVRNYLTVYVLTDQTPTAGSTRNTRFWAVLAYDGRWRLEKSRARAENRKSQFPSARGPEIEEKKVTTLSGMVVRNFCIFYVLANRTPRGGKIAKYGDFRPS